MNPTLALTFQSDELVVDVDQSRSVDVLVPADVPPDTCVTCCVGADADASNAGVTDPPLVPLHPAHARFTAWNAIDRPRPASLRLALGGDAPAVAMPVVLLNVPTPMGDDAVARASNWAALVSLTACWVTSLLLCASDTV